jgi:hypothetical protein
MTMTFKKILRIKTVKVLLGVFALIVIYNVTTAKNDFKAEISNGYEDSEGSANVTYLIITADIDQFKIFIPGIIRKDIELALKDNLDKINTVDVTVEVHNTVMYGALVANIVDANVVELKQLMKSDHGLKSVIHYNQQLEKWHGIGGTGFEY